MLGQMGGPSGTTSLRKLTETNQDRNAAKHGGSPIAALRQPLDVPFNGRGYPRCLDTINGRRKHIVVLEHDNLPRRTGDHDATLCTLCCRNTLSSLRNG